MSTDFGDAPDVRVPSTRITQIVLNLLLNAADALADRAVERQLRRGGGSRTADGRAVIEVRDNGPGMTPGDAPPPVRARPHRQDASGTDGGTSLGLGLAISRQLARLSGGDITVTCPPSGGTVFRVVLPPAN